MKRWWVSIAIVFLVASSVGLAQTPSVADLLLELQRVHDQLVALLPISVPPGSTIVVPAGGDLQAAIDQSKQGDIIRLMSGATYTGNFVLRNKLGSATIVITSTSGVPAANTRVSPAAKLAILASPNSSPVLVTDQGAHNYVLVGVEIAGNGGGDLVDFGDGSAAQTSLVGLAHDLILDRCYIHGDPTLGQKRGVALNSGTAKILNSYIADIKAIGQDTQAVASWNGPGPYDIENNYLEAATENILFGGADPSIPNLVPSDIVVRNNTITKPISWRTQPWLIKNLVELKNARRVLVEGNTITNVWLQGQAGYAIVITVRNQDGGCPWCTIQNATFRNNAIAHMAGGVNVLALDDTHPSTRMSNVVFDGNTFDDIDGIAYGSNGRTFMIVGPDGPQGFSILDTKVNGQHMNSAIVFDDLKVLAEGMIVSGNFFQEGDYGIIGGTTGALGQAALDRFAPGWMWTGNTVVKGTSGRNIVYPSGTVVQ